VVKIVYVYKKKKIKISMTIIIILDVYFMIYSIRNNTLYVNLYMFKPQRKIESIKKSTVGNRLYYKPYNNNLPSQYYHAHNFYCQKTISNDG
jgi:hypothetical protein